MKIQSYKILNIIAFFSILTGLFLSFIHPSFALTNTVGSLEYTYDSSPIFDYANLAPGDVVSKNLTVRNLSSSQQVIGIQGTKTEDSTNLAQQISFKISVGGSEIYSKTLADFFADGEISLSTLGGGESKTFVLEAVFNSGAGNEFQGKKVMFDLTVGALGQSNTNPSNPTETNNQANQNSPAVLGQSTGEVLGISTFPETGASFLVVLFLFFCLGFGLLIKKFAKKTSSRTHS